MDAGPGEEGQNAVSSPYDLPMVCPGPVAGCWHCYRAEALWHPGEFEATFKVLAVSLAMLPMLVMSALYLSLLAFGAALAVLMALHAAGFDLSVIPHRHQIFGLLALAAAALCVSGVPWFRYVLLVYCEGK